MKKDLLAIAAVMMIAALSYSCGAKEQPEPPLGPATNTFTIDGESHDISAVSRSEGMHKNEYRFFKITAPAAGGVVPTIYFKYSSTKFGKTVDISKTNSLMFFLYAEMSVVDPPQLPVTFAIVDYDNGHNRHTGDMVASGTLRIDQISSKNYRIKFDAVIDGKKYECDFGGDISDIYFD